jgi:ATP/maltotriose-dependent transcriptional regulator MalT
MLENLPKQLVENLGLVISSIAFLIGTIGLILALACHRKYKAQYELIEFLGQQSDDLDEMVSKNRELLEKGHQQTLDQSRRIAWLESRFRQPKTVVKEEVAVEETPKSEILKAPITERRHRVLALYAKGNSPETIASTLGMMPGEVELMVKLNQAPLYI